MFVRDIIVRLILGVVFVVTSIYAGWWLDNRAPDFGGMERHMKSENIKKRCSGGSWSEKSYIDPPRLTYTCGGWKYRHTLPMLTGFDVEFGTTSDNVTQFTRMTKAYARDGEHLRARDYYREICGPPVINLKDVGWSEYDCGNKWTVIVAREGGDDGNGIAIMTYDRTHRVGTLDYEKGLRQ